ncbi:hypothetical protein KKI21_00175 [Patescibacteria group bacterium]|nr:hypothetical protein [Patescibacteria group bacterium]MCG2696341.1 hypothetical protein [Candidatus Portnoybacteria bacterium]
MMNLFSKLPTISSTTIVSSQKELKFLTQAKSAWIGFGASVNDFFHSYTWREIFFTIKVISFIFSILMLLAIIFVIFKKMTLGAIAKPVESDKKKKKSAKKWAKIEKKFKSGVEANYKLAILEADSFYDKVLKTPGREKEKNLSNVDEIKKAKRVKARIIDDSGYVLIEEEARNTLDAYKKGLEELGVM